MHVDLILKMRKAARFARRLRCDLDLGAAIQIQKVRNTEHPDAIQTLGLIVPQTAREGSETFGPLQLTRYQYAKHQRARDYVIFSLRSIYCLKNKQLQQGNTRKSQFWWKHNHFSTPLFRNLNATCSC